MDAAAVTFAEWGRLTRFLESARLAFARERNLWESLELAAPAEVRIAAPAYKGRSRVKLEHHLAAVSDEEMLYVAVLIHSYALAESAASAHLGADVRTIGAIEDWAPRLLAANSCAWADVKGGKGGIVEVAVVRNALAHGVRTIDAKASQRLNRAGVQGRPAGSPIALSHTDVGDYRLRLLSLLRAGGIRRQNDEGPPRGGPSDQADAAAR